LRSSTVVFLQSFTLAVFAARSLLNSPIAAGGGARVVRRVAAAHHGHASALHEGGAAAGPADGVAGRALVDAVPAADVGGRVVALRVAVHVAQADDGRLVQGGKVGTWRTHR